MTEPPYKQIDINSEITSDDVQEYDPEYYWYNVTNNEYLGKYKNSRKFSKSNGEESYHQFENGLAGGCSWVLIGSNYSETVPNIIKRVINNKKLVELKEKTIVDIGSGKGRVLILFAEKGVKRCIGIEISSVLNKIAHKNSQIWKKKNTDSNAEFTFETIDASKYILPDEVDLVYLFNPFDAFILSQVIDTIKKSYLSNPREIFIIYMFPIHKVLFDNSLFQTIYSFQSDYIIYRTLEDNNNEVS